MGQDRGVRALVGIAGAGLALGLVLSILAVRQEMAATQGNECAPYFDEHHLAPLPLSVLLFGWLGLTCAIAGAAAAYQVNLGRFWNGVRIGSVLVVVVGVVSVVLIYLPMFFQVPVCAVSMPAGL
ncbi:MAG TPA: hypothetical protein VHZ97_27175 [Pseudonocardiaceae bacterium]|nr:hypothetical protein [Pseudonocardiaceae bacterium]